jgi:hypothetical protein
MLLCAKIRPSLEPYPQDIKLRHSPIYTEINNAPLAYLTLYELNAPDILGVEIDHVVLA